MAYRKKDYHRADVKREQP